MPGHPGHLYQSLSSCWDSALFSHGSQDREGASTQPSLIWSKRGLATRPRGRGQKRDLHWARQDLLIGFQLHLTERVKFCRVPQVGGGFRAEGPTEAQAWTSVECRGFQGGCSAGRCQRGFLMLGRKRLSCRESRPPAACV